MSKRKHKIDKFLEAEVLVKQNGKIDLKKLWKMEEDQELEPDKVKKLQDKPLK